MNLMVGLVQVINTWGISTLIYAQGLIFIAFQGREWKRRLLICLAKYRPLQINVIAACVV